MELARRLAAAVRRPGGQRVIVLAVLHVVLVWTIAGGLIWQNYRDAVDDWKRTAESMALAITAYVGQTLRGADLVQESVLDWIGDEDIEAESQFRDVMAERRFYEAMRDRIVGVPQVGVVGIISREGTLLNSTFGFPVPRLELSDREAFTTALSQNTQSMQVSAPSPGRATGRFTFYLARKVSTRSGEVLGVVTVGLDVDYFAEFFRHVSIGEDSWITLYRADGTMLATSVKQPDALGKRFEKSFPRQLLAAGGSGVAVFTNEPSWRRPGEATARIVVPREVEGYPVFISLVIGKSVFLSRWEAASRVIVVLAMVVTLLTLLVGLWLLRLLGKTEAANRLASERSVLAAIVDTPSAMTAVLNAEGGIVRANPRFHQIFGQQDFRAADLKGGEALFAFITSGAELTELDLELARPGEPPRMLHFSLSRQALPEAGGCVVVVGHDETQRHQARRAIEQSAKLVTLGEITTGIAHEISQPLNVIRMAAQNALSEIEPDAELGGHDAMAMSDADFRSFVAGKLHRVIAQVDRAASIISRMRIFSRSARQGRHSFDVRVACEAAIALVRQQFRRVGIAIHTSYAEEPLVTTGYQVTLEEVLVSLLINARDVLSDIGRTKKTVQISTLRGTSGGIVVLVADNGPGVPAAIRDRIFEPFFTTKPVGEGTGLGLATAYGLVRDAGGALSLCEGGPGATFRIELPAAAADEGSKTNFQAGPKS